MDSPGFIRQTHTKWGGSPTLSFRLGAWKPPGCQLAEEATAARELWCAIHSVCHAVQSVESNPAPVLQRIHTSNCKEMAI